jgi:single-strand DNA-binding protein
MFETPLTVVGRIITEPRRRRIGEQGEQEVISFRMASNSRRRSADGSWEAGNSLYITVNCWGKLVTGVGAALFKGDAVIAHGHVYTSEYDDREGQRRSSLEMRAITVGPDLSRSIVRIIDRGGNAGRDATVAETIGNDEPAGDVDTEVEGEVSPGEGSALPLSA